MVRPKVRGVRLLTAAVILGIVAALAAAYGGGSDLCASGRYMGAYSHLGAGSSSPEIHRQFSSLLCHHLLRYLRHRGQNSY